MISRFPRTFLPLPSFLLDRASGGRRSCQIFLLEFVWNPVHCCTEINGQSKTWHKSKLAFLRLFCVVVKRMIRLIITLVSRDHKYLLTVPFKLNTSWNRGIGVSISRFRKALTGYKTLDQLIAPVGWMS